MREIRSLHVYGSHSYHASESEQIRIREAREPADGMIAGTTGYMTTYLVERYQLAGQWSRVARVPGWMAVAEYEP